MQGVVRDWALLRGFGFLRDAEGRDHFLHIDDLLKAGICVIGRGDVVEFRPGERDGKPLALNPRILAPGNRTVWRLLKQRPKRRAA